MAGGGLCRLIAWYRNALHYLNYLRKLYFAIRKLPHIWQERAYVSLLLTSANPIRSTFIVNSTDCDCEALDHVVPRRNAITSLQLPYNAKYRLLIPKKSVLHADYCLPRRSNPNNAILYIGIAVSIADHPIMSIKRTVIYDESYKWEKVRINLSRIAGAEADIAISLNLVEHTNDPTLMEDVLCCGPILTSYKGFRNIAHKCVSYLIAYGIRGLCQKINLLGLSVNGATREISQKDYISGGLLCNLLQQAEAIGNASSIIASGSDKNNPVDILIPIYDAYEHLDICLRRVFNNTDLPARVILINDCSTDPRITALLEQCKRNNPDNKNILSIIIENNSLNCGFTKTVNLGLGISKGHVVLLNTDVKVPPNWLSRLLKPIVEKPDIIASVTPFSNRATICSFPEICRDNKMYLNLEVDEIDSMFKRYAPCDWIQIPVGVGFCMAMNRKTLDMIGFLDEIHFPRGYGEENDWCMRATKTGFQNVLTPRLFVEHDHGMSWNSLGQNVRQNLIEDGLRNLEKLHPGYGLRIQKFIDDDPIYSLRKLLISLTNATQKRLRRNMLVLTSGLSGGSDGYLRDLMDVMAMDAEIFTCYFDVETNSSVLTHFCGDGRPVYYRMRGNIFTPQVLREICCLFSIDLIFVNHLLTFPDFQEILASLPLLGIPYVMVIHDYLAVCYSWHLLNDNKEYCQAVKDNDHCNECIKRGFLGGMYYSSFGLTGNFDANNWRGLWGEALGSAKSVICFSVSSRDILVGYYPFLSGNITTIPHLVLSPVCGESCA